MFDELAEVKYFKENTLKCFQGLESLQVKADVYLKLKRAAMMKLFVKIVNNLSFLQQKKIHHR